MIPRLYKYDDPNAPVLSGTAGAAYNVLKKCLVDGYGEKVGAGWTIAYENIEETIGVLQGNPLTSNGFFLKIIDSQSSKTFTCQAAEVYSDIDTFIGPFNSSPLSVIKSFTTDTTPRRWAILATDKFFYFIANYAAPTTGDIIDNNVIANNNYAMTLFFGDFNKYSDEYFNSVLGLGTGYSTNSYGYLYGLFSSPQNIGSNGPGSYIFSPRPLAGTPNTPVEMGFLHPGGPFSFINASSNCYRTEGSIDYDPAELWLSGPLVLFDSGTKDVRGALPGWRYPCHDFSVFADQNLFLTTITVDTREFLIVQWGGCYSTNYSYLSCCFAMIELGVDWDA
jgi:hypothetical protein